MKSVIKTKLTEEPQLGIFLSAGCFEHPGGKDTFVKGLDEDVYKRQDGDIDEFIFAYLKAASRGELPDAYAPVPVKS